MEHFKEMVNTNGLYIISDTGIVKRRGRIVKSFVRNDGYFYMVTSIKCKITNKCIHREVFKAFVGPIPDGMEINHKDGNKLNNSIDNLELCTPSENSRHAIAVLGKQCKLSPADVIEIREMLSDKINRKQIAAQFNVSKSVIDHISTGYSWSYV